MSYGFKIMVKGDYAAFNRPEMKVERVSYDVPTPGVRSHFEGHSFDSVTIYLLLH